MTRVSVLLLLALSACSEAKPPAAPAPARASAAPAAVAPPEPEPEPIATEAPVDDSVAPPAPPPAEPPAAAASVAPPEPSDPDVRAALADFDAGNGARGAKRLVSAVQRIDHSAPLEDRMMAHALLGRRLRLHGNATGAKREYDKVLAAWADPAAGLKEIVGDKPDDPVALRRVGQALTAVGEALFAEAEVKRKKALSLHAPAFHGAASDAAIKQHLTTAVKDWMGKRRAAEHEAEEAYRKVLSIQPLPPPRWVIASAAQVGSMLEALPGELDALPVPPSIAKDPKLRQVYRDALHDAGEPQRQNAKAAYRMCQQLSAKYQYEDPYSKHCATRLAALGG